METYNPDDVSMTLGTTPIEGVMDGTFILIEPNAPDWKKKVGAQGNVARTRIEDESYRVTITLMGSSPSNKDLTGINKTDKATGQGQLPFLMEDLSGEDMFFATNAWIEGKPALSKGDDITPVVWIIECEKGEILIGGNA